MERIVTAFVIVIVLSPLLFVGTLGGAGIAMLFQKIEGPPYAALGLIAGSGLAFWAALKLIDRVSDSRLGKSRFWAVSSRRVWKTAAMMAMAVGVIGGTAALFSTG